MQSGSGGPDHLSSGNNLRSQETLRAGLEELSRKEADLIVKVIVLPKGKLTTTTLSFSEFAFPTFSNQLRSRHWPSQFCESRPGGRIHRTIANNP